MTLRLKKLFLYFLPLGFIPYILICFYNNPNADDFLFGALAQKGDLWETWLDQYHSIGGRYTSNLLVLLGPLKYRSFLLYKFIPMIILVLHWFSIKGLIKSLIGKYLSRVELHIATYLLVFLFIYQMPIISEGLYWYSGAVAYLMGCIVATWYLTMLIMFWQGKYILKNSFFHIASITMLTVFAVGFNEVLMLLMNAFAIVIFILVWGNKLSKKWETTYLLIVILAASSIVLFAPGNTVRSEQYPLQHEWLYSLYMSLLQTLRFFVTWIFSAPLWIASFAYYFVHERLVSEHPLFKNSFYLGVNTSTNLLWIVIFLCVYPAYWATGMLGQHRTLNVAYFFFLILWFVNLTVWFNWAELSLTKLREPNRKTTIVLFVILLGCFLFVKNGYYVTTDIITGRARTFDIQMNIRYAQMKSDVNPIYFNAIKDPPKSLPFYEVKEDPKHWFNLCWTRYFNRENDRVVLKE